MKSRAGPNGVHLFDRRSGLNILLDELQSDEGEWAKAPRQVSVALTNVCDLHCAYCYAPKHKASLREDDVVTWLKEIDGAGCLGVGFGGGEPTLHPGFSEICRRVAEETQLAVTFTDLPGFFVPIVPRKSAPRLRGDHAKRSIHRRADGRDPARG